MFKKYAPKFILVDAIRVTEENLEEVATLCKGSVRGTRLPPNDRIIEFHNKLHDSTLHVNVGEWLMKGKDEGDFYPCKDEVFSQKYIEHKDEVLSKKYFENSDLPFEIKKGIKKKNECLKWECEGFVSVENSSFSICIPKMSILQLNCDGVGFVDFIVNNKDYAIQRTIRLKKNDSIRFRKITNE